MYNIHVICFKPFLDDVNSNSKVVASVSWKFLHLALPFDIYFTYWRLAIFYKLI